jgi:hypothetical protein
MKQYCLRFLVLILPLLACFNTATAQQNQPELVSSFPLSVSYDVLKLNVDKTRIQVNLDSEGKVVSLKLLKGNALLFVKIKNDLAKWIFDESSEPQRSITLEVGAEDSNKNYYWNRKTIISPYRIEVKIIAPVLSLVPPDWEEGSASCEVHHEALIKDKLRIAYGLIGFLYDYEAYVKDAPKLFPHAKSFYGGGCLIEQYSPEYIEVLYCQKCRAAESVWVKENSREEPK